MAFKDWFEYEREGFKNKDFLYMLEEKKGKEMNDQAVIEQAPIEEAPVNPVVPAEQEGVVTVHVQTEAEVGHEEPVIL